MRMESGGGGREDKVEAASKKESKEAPSGANCLLPLWGKFAVAPGGTGDGPGGTRVHRRYFQRLLQLVQGHGTLEC
jgi:hypothetical protein